MRFPAITGYRQSTPVKAVLSLGAYVTQSLIAEAQRCINLYPELNPPDAPFPTTHYPTPGLVSWSTSPATGASTIPRGRGIYYSTRGQLFAVVGPVLYYVDPTGVWNPVGTLGSQIGPVGMVDNGETLLVVAGPSGLQQQASPVSAVTTLPYSASQPPPIGYPPTGNAVTFPGVLEFGVAFAQSSTSSAALVLLATPGSSPNTPNGYQLLLNLQAGEQLITLQRAQNGSLTAIGTYYFPPLAAAIGSPINYTVTLVVAPGGVFQVYVNGVLYVSAVDTTFSNFEQTYYYAGTSTTVAQIGPALAITPAVYLVNLATLQFGTIVNPAIYGGTHTAYLDTFFLTNYPDTQEFYISTSNLQLIDAEEGPIAQLNLTAGGTGYANGSFANVPLTGGTGTGAQANITVAGGIVTSVTLTNPGSGYAVGDTLGATLNSAAGVGSISSLSLSSPGSKLVAGTYTNLNLTGGTGTGAQATLTVTAFGVTSFSLTNAGSGYTSGDLLTAPVPIAQHLNSPEYQGGSEPVFTASVAAASTGSGLALAVVELNLISAVNALNIAAKTGFADLLQGLLVIHREIWLFGKQTIEVWGDAGNPLFPFQIMSGVFIQRGLLAPYSLAKFDLMPFWLGSDPTGRGIVFMGSQYNAVRISTFALEQAIQQYPTLEDAIGFTYQQNGHAFYVLNFPSGDATWVYDINTQLWHQRGTVDQDGTVHRALPISYANAYGKDIVQRWDTGDLMLYDTEVYDELGEPVTRIRGFPHIQDELRRIVYNHFIADMEVGQPIGPNTASAYPRSVLLRWSDTAGQTWSEPLALNLTPGKFNQLLKWNRLGMGRDRVFEIQWTAAVKTALNGAWISLIAADS